MANLSKNGTMDINVFILKGKRELRVTDYLVLEIVTYVPSMSELSVQTQLKVRILNANFPKQKGSLYFGRVL